MANVKLAEEMADEETAELIQDSIADTIRSALKKNKKLINYFFISAFLYFALLIFIKICFVNNETRLIVYRFILFLLIVIVFYIIVSKIMSENKGIGALISIVISVISVIAIPEDVILTIFGTWAVFFIGVFVFIVLAFLYLGIVKGGTHSFVVFIMFIIFVVLLLLGAMFLANRVSSVDCFSYLPSIENIKDFKIKPVDWFNGNKTKESIIDKFTKQFSWESQLVKTDKQYGITINKFQTMKDYYYSNETIDVIGSINVIASEEDDVIINFKDACRLDNQIVSPDVSGVSNIKDVRVFKGESEDFTIVCSFNGVKEIKNDEETKDIYLMPSLDYSQEAFIKVLSKGEQGDNDKETSVSYYKPKGPMKAAITFSDKAQQNIQFYEGLRYFVGVGLRKDAGWEGYLNKLYKVELLVPNHETTQVELQNKDPKQICQFNDYGKENGYSIYTIKDENLKRANVDCNDKSFLKQEGLLFEECIERYKNNIAYFCWFKFTKTESQDRFTEDQFKARFRYNFQVKKLINSVRIKKVVEKFLKK